VFLLGRGKVRVGFFGCAVIRGLEPGEIDIFGDVEDFVVMRSYHGNGK
jgi:hypothetical protein